MRRSAVGGFDFGTEFGAFGMAEVLEDAERSQPGVACGGLLSRGAMAIRHLGQRSGLVVAVAQVLVQPQRLAVTAHRIGVPNQVVVRVTETVPVGRLADPATGGLVRGESLAAGHDGLLIVTQLSAVPADGIERVGLTCLVPRRTERFTGLPGV